MNVGTAVCLPPHRKVAADRASGDRTPPGRGSVVVAGVNEWGRTRRNRYTLRELWTLFCAKLRGHIQ